MDENKTLASVYERLIEPFSPKDIELRPGATTRDKAKALALPYADVRVYQERLDTVVGPENWSVEYRPLSEIVVFCRLTILGVVREDVGECHKVDKDGVPDENRACTAVAQAFKRACSAFGLGRYLYSLPQIWGEFDAQRKQFTDPARVVQEIYRKAGLRVGERSSAPPRAPSPPRASSPPPVTSQARAAIAAFAPTDDSPPPREEAPKSTREDILAARLRNAPDEAGLRAVGDEIRQAREQNEIDEAARKRLETLYRQCQQQLGGKAPRRPARAVVQNK